MIDDRFFALDNGSPMDAETAASRFGELFVELYRRFHRRLGPADYRLTEESLAVLRHLAGTGPLTIGEAAVHLSRSQAATSEIVGRLVGRGLLEKLPDTRDRRRVLVWLTESGRRELDRAQRVLSVELLGEAFRRLPDRDRAAVIIAAETLLATPIREREDG